jgi:hypothetical protein
MDTVSESWEAFFESLLDEPQRAEALCALGMMVVQGEAISFPLSGTSRWMAFFRLLVGRAEAARGLCLLGLKVVEREMIPDEAARSLVREVLQTHRRNAVR